MIDTSIGGVSARLRVLPRPRRKLWIGTALLALFLVGGTRATQGTPAIAELQAQAQLQLQSDPGKALSYVAEAARLRGTATQEEYLLAVAALSKGVGWEVSQQSELAHSHQSVGTLVFNPEAPRATPAKDAARFWPERKWLAWAWADGGVAVVDLNRSSPPTELVAATKNLYGAYLAFSPDGRWLLRSDISGNVRIWNVAAGLSRDPVFTRPGLSKGQVYDKPKFSADGQFLALRIAHELIILKAPSWQEYYRIPQVDAYTFLPEPADALMFSPPTLQGGGLAAKTIALTRCTLGNKQCTSSELPFYEVRRFVADPYTGRLAINGGAFARGAKELEIREPPYDKVLKKTRIDLNANFDFLDKDKLLISVGTSVYTQSLAFRDAEERYVDYELAGHLQGVRRTQIVRSGDKTWILSLGGEGVAHLHLNGKLARQLQLGEETLQSAALSPDGAMVAGGLFEGSVRLWFNDAVGDKQLMASGNYLRSIDTQDPSSLIVASGGNIGDGDSGPYEQIGAWRKSGSESVSTGVLLQSFVPSGSDSCKDTLVCLAEKDLVVAATQCDGIRFWRVGAATVERQIIGTGPVSKLVCLPGGGVLAASAQGVNFWPAQSPERRALSPEAPDRVVALTASPRGDTVLAAWSDGTLRSWDTREWKRTDTAAKVSVVTAALLDGQTALVADPQGSVWEVPLGGGKPTRSAALSPASRIKVARDGKLVATVQRGAVRIGFRDGPRMYRLAHGYAVGDLTFADDGRTLLEASYSGVQLYPLPPPDLQALGSWLAPRAPFAIEGGVLIPKRFPGLPKLLGSPP